MIIEASAGPILFNAAEMLSRKRSFLDRFQIYPKVVSILILKNPRMVEIDTVLGNPKSIFSASELCAIKIV